MKKSIVIFILIVISICFCHHFSTVHYTDSSDSFTEEFQLDLRTTEGNNVVHDGVVSAAEYDVSLSLDADFKFYYTIDGSDIFMALEGKTAGWVAIGIDPVSSSNMTEADIIIGYYSDTFGHGIRDDYANTSTTHYNDTIFGGTNDILSFNMSEEKITGKYWTTLEFSRKLNTQDVYDNPITVGVNISLFWAYSDADDFTAVATTQGFSSTIFLEYNVPSPPLNLIATPGNESITLNWSSPLDDGNLNIFRFNVYRSQTNTSNYTMIGMNSSTTGFFDTNVINGARYFYFVTAENNKGESSNSNEVTLIPGTPSPPLNLSLTSDTTQMILNWTLPLTDSGYTITEYIIYRSSISGGPYSNIATTNELNYTDTTVLAGNTYYYVVTAINSIGESEFSNEVSIVLPETTTTITTSTPTTTPTSTPTTTPTSIPTTTPTSIPTTTPTSTPTGTSTSTPTGTSTSTPTGTSTSTSTDTNTSTSTDTTSKKGSFPNIIVVTLFIGILVISIRKEQN
ncbi:MAG: DOMON domain-containing protein [Promethearchaeota archaeon]